MEGRHLWCLQPFDLLPEHWRGFPFAAFPLIDHGLAGRADLVGQLLLAETQTASKAHESGRVVCRHRHAADGHSTRSASTRTRICCTPSRPPSRARHGHAARRAPARPSGIVPRPCCLGSGGHHGVGRGFTMDYAVQRFRRQAGRELGDRQGAESRYSDGFRQQAVADWRAREATGDGGARRRRRARHRPGEPPASTDSASGPHSEPTGHQTLKGTLLRRSDPCMIRFQDSGKPSSGPLSDSLI